MSVQLVFRIRQLKIMYKPYPVELSKQGAVLPLVLQGARPPQHPSVDVLRNQMAPTTWPAWRTASNGSRDGVFIL